MNTKQISVYAPNLSERKDRLKSIQRQFSGKPEFDFAVVPAIRHETGAFGQWQTFVKLVKQELKKNSEFFIFCEDDHVFTKDYRFEYLLECIRQADCFGADILCGGIAYVIDAIRCTDHLFWMKTFNGMQFTVIFNRFYQKIIQSDTEEGFISDHYLSEISDHKFVMHPFISIQKEFGYSDITAQNNQKGYVRRCFKTIDEKLHLLKKVEQFYKKATYEIR